MTKEALKLALEALEFIPKSGSMLGAQAEVKRLQAITALQEELTLQQLSKPCLCGKQTMAWCMANTCSKAQPEQEPVAYGMWDTMLGYGGRMMMVRLDKGQDGCTVPLYTAPAHQNVNVDDIGVPVGVGGWLTTTSSQPEQEPVAGMLEPIGILMKLEGDKHMKLYAMDEQLEQQLVTTDEEWDGVLHKGVIHSEKVINQPPQRKPLTDEEIVLIVAECAASHQHTDIHFARAIEAAHGIKGEA